ncbi:hypothetical protein [Bacillus sp. AR18-7]|uniref:hypothetical protein n=1 Tax=Bacillus sp. AR18-7 TaxID=2217821 RepID=UPI0011C7B21A|nr:hypothetical protein [Bacillus sp. AR18-7]TXR64568.1 hypothetical protein DN395_11590 [Bacillus sp. AR18-7]
MESAKCKGLEKRLEQNKKILSIRLEVEEERYAYVFIKTKFNNEKLIVHLIDRQHLDSGVSIIDCIEDVQEQIIDYFAAHEFMYRFINDSKWMLYGKNGEIKECIFGEQQRISHVFDYVLAEEFLELTLERNGKRMSYDLFAGI